MKKRLLSCLMVLALTCSLLPASVLAEEVKNEPSVPAAGEAQLTPEMQAKMKKIEGCLHCNKCKSKCPYGLDTPALLAKNYEDYKRVLAGEVSVK